jgi:hypothetical protein
MEAQKCRPDAEGRCNAHTCDKRTKASECFVDISCKTDDLCNKLVERGSRYEQAYHSEHHKLLVITAAQRTLIVENERLKHEVEHLKQSALPGHDCCLHD